MPSIPELELQKRKVHEVFSKADAALHHGRITRQEYDAILSHYYGTPSEKAAIRAIDRQMKELRTPQIGRASLALIIGFSIVMFSMFATLLYTTAPTGAVTKQEGSVPQPQHVQKIEREKEEMISSPPHS